VTKRLLVTIVALALASFALAACGGDDEASTTAESETAGSTEASAGGATVSFTAEPSGQLAFTETEVTAPAGEDTIELDNPSATAHNVVIEDADGNDVAETDTISGDTTSTTATLEPGTYTFYCDVDSHREAGMEGTLTVE